MAVADPEAWVRNVERLYQAHDAAGVAALYLPEARTKFGSLDDYVLTRTFRAAYGDIIVSETTASYTIRAEGRRCREFGVDVYWVNDDGLIYHKHTCEVVEDYRDDALDAADEACRVHQGTPS